MQPVLDKLWDIAGGFWFVLGEMSPYLLFGFLVAGALSVLIRPELVERHLGGGGFMSIFKASALGVPLPLCSCGVIPVGTSLRRHGASKAATTAFLISTPQTGVDSIFVTYSLLGGVFALFRPIAALIAGVLGGAAVALAEKEPPTPAEAPKDACQDACCSGRGQGKLRTALSYGLITLPRDIGKTLVIGLAVAAMISALVPPHFLAEVGGGVLASGILGMLAMMLLGIPVYVCATASVPLAWALIQKGVSPGVALVFLMTGPATNAATIATIGKVMGKKTALLYLASVAGTALAAGMLLDYTFQVGHLKAQPGGMWMLPGWFQTACAVALLGVLAGAIWPRKGAADDHAHGPEQAEAVAAPGPASPAREPAGEAGSIVFEVGGMTCSHCAGAVRRALAESPGVTEAHVDLESGRARVAGAGLDGEQLARAVAGLGYRVRVVPDSG